MDNNSSDPHINLVTRLLLLLQQTACHIPESAGLRRLKVLWCDLQDLAV